MDLLIYGTKYVFHHPVHESFIWKEQYLGKY